MSDPVKWILLAILSYLLGSLNAAVILSKAVRKDDVRKYGSGNAGLTNAYRIMGGKMAFLVFLGDFTKGLAAGAIGYGFFGQTGALIGGLFAVAGHNWPVFFGFRGGKGILTGAAMVLAFDWRIFIAVILPFLILTALTRYVSFGSMVAAVIFPIVTILLHPGNVICISVSVLVCGVILWLHRGNIGRLIHGTEPKLTSHKKTNARQPTHVNESDSPETE